MFKIIGRFFSRFHLNYIINFELFKIIFRPYYISIFFFLSIDQYPTLQLSVGQVWRFAPMVDPLVSEFHSRDLDSIISHREFAAVNDWLSNTNRTFHIMRDHKQHASAIPGEMFCKF